MNFRLAMGNRVAGVRIVFGLMFAADAYLKWPPAFRAEYLSLLTNAANGQPAWLHPWFQFWISIVTPRVGIFATMTAIIESLIALCLILGFARRVAYLVGALFALGVWSTAEGFGAPFMSGATDIGAGVIYAVVFACLYGLDTFVGASAWSLDHWLEQRVSWWRVLADPSQPTVPPSPGSLP